MKRDAPTRAIRRWHLREGAVVRLRNRLVQSATGAGELGLALFMTAGVVYCGGSVEPPSGEATADAGADHGGPGIEAAAGDGGPGPVVEAAIFTDAGAEASPSPMVEAPCCVEAVSYPDAGSDASPSPMVEAPVPVEDAGSDAHLSPWPEAPK